MVMQGRGRVAGPMTDWATVLCASLSMLNRLGGGGEGDNFLFGNIAAATNQSIFLKIFQVIFVKLGCAN
jgi:hypothetical protein